MPQSRRAIIKFDGNKQHDKRQQEGSRQWGTEGGKDEGRQTNFCTSKSSGKIDSNFIALCAAAASSGRRKGKGRGGECLRRCLRLSQWVARRGRGSLQLIAGDIYRLLDLPAGCISTCEEEQGSGSWEARGNFVFCADLISQLKTFHNCKRQHATRVWVGYVVGPTKAWEAARQSARLIDRQLNQVASLHSTVCWQLTLLSPIGSATN